MEIGGQVALVTGAASGMGSATAQLLAKQGAKVALLDLQEDALKTIAQKCNGLACAADVTCEAEVESALDQIQSHFGQCAKIVVHCAGIVEGQRVLSKKGPHPLDDFHRVINVNLIGTFNIIRLTAHRISQQCSRPDENGVIVQTASIAAFEGQIGQAAYSASKGAVAAMTLPIARELARFGIRVMTIAPGLIETPMMESIPEGIRDDLLAGVAYPKRFGAPTEFAQLVQHIIQNPYLNGEVIRLDAGLRMLA